MVQGVWGRAIVAGLVASLVMGMWQMAAEAIRGDGLFSPPVYIAATLLRDLQDTQGAPGLGPIEPLGILVGLMGHMMNSVVLTLVFAAVAPRITRSWVGLAVLGMVWGIVVFIVMRFAVIPLLDPVMERLDTGAFLLGHLMWGLVVGAILAWGVAPQRARAPAQ